MKLYKNLAEAVVKAIQSIFGDKLKADRVVEQTLQSNRKWGSRDRRFIARYIYEVVRWYRLYYEVGLNGKEPQSQNDWWQLLATAWVLDGMEIPDWPELYGMNKEEILQRNSDLHTKRVVYSSIPDWFDKLGVEELGEKLWTDTIEALNQPAKVVLRVNTLKTTRPKFLEQLTRVGIEGVSFGGENAVVIEEAKNLTDLQLYKDGCFEIQDYSSQQIVPYLYPVKGAVVVDACAGAGGKSLHLAAWLQNRGFIKAMDVEEPKLKELEKRAKRSGAQIITTQMIGKKATISDSWCNICDYLLLDVPCSGTGVMRRNPDAKWKLSLDFIEEIKTTQRHILGEYHKMLRPGGYLLYATCSILTSENEKQVAWFLNETEAGKNFKLLKEKRIMPQDDGFDGFYMAVLQKNQ